jgi:ribosome-binding protein aMBF1 (putative translation factor)
MKRKTLKSTKLTRTFYCSVCGRRATGCTSAKYCEVCREKLKGIYGEQRQRKIELIRNRTQLKGACDICGKPMSYSKDGTVSQCASCLQQLEGVEGQHAINRVVKQIREASPYLNVSEISDREPRNCNTARNVSGKDLKRRREALGISQMDLSIEAEVAYRSVQAAEQGWRSPSKKLIAALEALEAELLAAKKG